MAFLCLRSRPQAGGCARPWSRSSWRPRAPPRTTRRCRPPRRWWTAWPSSPSRRPASPRCCSAWPRYPRDAAHYEKEKQKALFTLHASLPPLLLPTSTLWKMPYLFRLSVPFVGNGIRSGRGPAAVTKLYFLFFFLRVFWCCSPSVSGLPLFIYWPPCFDGARHTPSFLFFWVLTYWIFEAWTWTACLLQAFFFLLYCVCHFCPPLTW